MQIDFHFHAIYALARCAGFAANHAHTVAYASQHTDDAIHDHALEFKNGGRFQQVLSAHRLLHPRAISRATCYQIWIPFHFLPGNSGVAFHERMVCRPGSMVMQKLQDDLLRSAQKPYLLHRLGIALHVLADTWSHQNFLGLLNEEFNDALKLKVKNETRASLKNTLEQLKTEVLEYCAPTLGHAQAGTLPDEPWREWQYQNRAGRSFEVSNLKRSLDAAQACSFFLGRFLAAFPGFAVAPPLPWHLIAPKLQERFAQGAPLAGRVAAWQAAIAAGEPGFRACKEDKALGYDDRQWFREAVVVSKTADSAEQYERKSGFETSHWKYFHDAAALHRFTVLHEILPECGMVCG